MALAGEPVAEIDISASFLTILHSVRGWPLDGASDHYEIKHIPRAVVKMWVTMTIGFHQFHDDWPAGAAKGLAERGIDVRRYPLKEVPPKELALSRPRIKTSPSTRS